MRKYRNITDHVIIDRDNQSKKKKKPRVPPEKRFMTITIRVDPVIHGRFHAYCTKEGSTQLEVASEAIAYWVLFLAKEAGGEEIEQARADWEEIRMKRILNRKTTRRERIIMSRRSWTLEYPGRPWPGIKIAATSQKVGDVQTEMKL
jgi:hypothetical protein